MSWLAIVLIIVGGWLALKVAGAALKLVFWLAVAFGLWWLVHPYLGLPLIPF